MAGINAHLKRVNKEPFILSRSEAYIGVLIDDLITKGTKEPYRMFTSRAEYRILLRQDNADIRLTPLGYQLGLVDEEQMERVDKKVQGTNEFKKYLRTLGITPAEVNPLLLSKDSSPINQQVKITSILSRPQIQLNEIAEVLPELSNKCLEMSTIHEDIPTQTEIQLKYEGYIDREEEMASKLSRLEDVKIPEDIDFRQLKSLSTEAVEKLTAISPRTIGQASRISGVSPSDVSVLLIYLGR
jgi:tRNA uridine 5-carboxymethylaminomethyl modification enzyme